MTYSNDVKDLIEVIRWHIVRADGQRSGLWTRAAAVLSADALVIAGSAGLASASSNAAWWSLAAAVLPIAAAMISIFQAINVVTGARAWSTRFGKKDSWPRLLY